MKLKVSIFVDNKACSPSVSMVTTSISYKSSHIPAALSNKVPLAEHWAEKHTI